MAKRPLYENADSLKDEARIIAYACERWGYESKKMPKAYRADYAIFKDGLLHGIAEVKRRRYDRFAFETFFISAGKFQACLEMGYMYNVAFLIFVQWNDVLAYWLWKPPNMYMQYQVRWGGRKDRNDAQDQEPMVHIPVKEFIVLRHTH